MCNLRSGALAQTVQNPGSTQRRGSEQIPEKTKQWDCKWRENVKNGELLMVMTAADFTASPGLESACWRSECPLLPHVGSFDSFSS